MRGSGHRSPHPPSSQHWPSSAWGRQQPYVGRGAVCSSAARRPGLPEPVTDDFPCLSGRPAHGRGGWGLWSHCVGCRSWSPALSPGPALQVDPGSRCWALNLTPRVSLDNLPPLLRPPLWSRLGPPEGSGWLVGMLPPGGGKAVRGAHGPGAPGRREGPVPRVAWGCEAAANLYTKCL